MPLVLCYQGNVVVSLAKTRAELSTNHEHQLMLHIITTEGQKNQADSQTISR